MLNIGSLVNLFDFGFSSQFSKNFSYVFSGAQELLPDGLSPDVSEKINYKLLKTLISTSARVYRFISTISLIVMLTAGTLYIKKFTGNFTLVNNSLIIWITYSISVFFNIYYLYLDPLVRGKGLIKRSQQAIIVSRAFYLLINFILLFFNFGLFSVVIANLVSPFISRFILLITFYTKEIKTELKKVSFSKEDKKKCFNIIWYNAKRMGINSLGSFAIQKSGVFFSGLFLQPAQIAMFGLLQQLSGIVNNLSTTLFKIFNPKIASDCVKNDTKSLIKDFSVTLGVFYLIYVFLSSCVAFAGPFGLRLIHSNAKLPALSFMLIFFIVQFLEQNHSTYATVIALHNYIPFVIPSLIAGGFIISGLYLTLSFTNLGIWSLILVPGIVQLAYANWKWPLYVCKNYLHMSIIKFTLLSVKEAFSYGKRTVLKLIRK